MFFPWILRDSKNFIPAYIQPKWYFLIAYAILRSIPNKLGGVIALAISIIILLIYPLYIKVNFEGLCSILLINFIFEFILIFEYY